MNSEKEEWCGLERLGEMSWEAESQSTEKTAGTENREDTEQGVSGGEWGAEGYRDR